MEEGRVMVVREEQLLKAISPMEVTEEGIVIEVREEQLLKALLLMEVREEGRVTESSERQEEKTPSAIDVIFSDDKSAYLLPRAELMEERK